MTTTTTRTTRTTERLLSAFAVLACTTACAAPSSVAPSPSRAAVTNVAPLHRGPLTDYVSAAGLRWLVAAKPRELLADPELGPAIRQLASDRRFDAFSESSGLDLRKTENAVIAGFAYSTLYLAEIPNGSAGLVRERFAERLLSGAVTTRSRPGLERTLGVIGRTPQALLTLEDRVLAVGVGDSTQIKIAEAYARARLKQSPTALRGAAIASLPDLTQTNAAVLFVPGPFSDEWQSAANGLLQSTVAVALTARPSGNGKLATTIYLSGAWDERASIAARGLNDAWVRFAQSSAGHLFALNEHATVESTPELLVLHVDLELDGLVRGLRASVLQDLGQIMNLRRKSGDDTADTAPLDPPSK